MQHAGMSISRSFILQQKAQKSPRSLSVMIVIVVQHREIHDPRIVKKCRNVDAVPFLTYILQIGTVITFSTTLETLHIQEALIATEHVVDVRCHLIRHPGEMPIAFAVPLPAVSVTGNMVDICQGR